MATSRTILPVSIGATSTVALAALALFATSPERVERLYVRGFGPPLAHAWGSVFALVPGSAAEWVETVAIAGGLAFVALVVREVRRAREPRPHVAARALLWAWALVTPALALFYLLWGLAYARPPAEERL